MCSSPSIYLLQNDTNIDNVEKSINVGWGSKATQFHGSLGKTAAKERSIAVHDIGSSPDDDGSPRISWKGDGSTFVVSSLEKSLLPPPPQSSSSSSSTTPIETQKHRILRYYSPQPKLRYLHPSELIAGLEHQLSWRPSGSLVASTQRFSPTLAGLGKGREGRHDVVFFEPNGLRHGEFGLRVDRWLASKKEGSKGKDVESWGYRVKELMWNSDSAVLAVWLEVKGEVASGSTGVNSDTNSNGFVRDIIQLWTTSNYHWYEARQISFDAVVSVLTRT